MMRVRIETYNQSQAAQAAKLASIFTQETHRPHPVQKPGDQDFTFVVEANIPDDKKDTLIDMAQKQLGSNTKIFLNDQEQPSLTAA